MGTSAVLPTTACSVVVGMDGHRGIAQDGLGARGAHLDEATIGQRIAEGVELTDHLFVLHLEIADGALQRGHQLTR